ncbi:MAG TPA: AAA family ATPase [Candidatus Nanoarchaeia archaeon]|nr:AAA family ATPase [Candidatus Nanoarchaeia archaeon]
MKAVITGGPCTGKTTLLGKLQEKGFHIVPEAPRFVIEQELLLQSNDQSYVPKVPWLDLASFEEKVIGVQVAFEHDWYDEQTAFLDRSLIDIIAYAELGGLDMEKRLTSEISAAGYETVFFLEPLPYKQDHARRESPEKAKRIHDRLVEVYERLGCDIVHVPACTLDQRVAYVCEHLVRAEGCEIEGKFIADHQRIRDHLRKFRTVALGTQREENHVVDAEELFVGQTGKVRVRKTNDSYELTWKGNRQPSLVNKRPEKNVPLTPRGYQLLRDSLGGIAYQKTRDTYCPVGNMHTRISLDVVDGLGEFVEVEAPTERQVMAWRNRLNLGNSISDSYVDLVKKVRGAA